MLHIWSATRFVLLCGALLAAAAAAQGPPRSLGPPGGIVIAIAVDPQDDATIYVGNRTGLYKNTHGGAGLWSDVSAGLADPRVEAVKVDPRDSSRLWAVSPGAAHRSLDGGASWQPAFPDAPFERVFRLIVHPADGSVLHAYTDGPHSDYRSRDGGATWAPVITGLPGFSIWNPMA